VVAGPSDPAESLLSGTVTFLFTDIERSTRLVQEIGTESYAQELMSHRRLIRDIVGTCGGHEFGAEGDSLFVAFERASDALAAADGIQRALAGRLVRVRIGVHSGEPLTVDGEYVGLDLHKTARICTAAHGGQVLVSQSTADLAGTRLRYLGECRLKDLAKPERLYQLGAGEFPPPRTLRRVNLPVQPSPLLGRDQEVVDLMALTRRHRLVTLTGPGGVGKTRLAMQVAAELAEEHVDGVWWVPLGSITDPNLVIPAIAETLGARGSLEEELEDRRLLLLLDNLEQVIDAAPRLSGLLTSTATLTLVVTSRERLAVSGEHEYPVPPLGDAAAAELFLARARQVKPDFEPDVLVPQICRRLDRLPLALELASTRVKVMTTRQILARLDRRFELLTGGSRDLPARQSTMQATLDWSYELLPVGEQRVFRGLAVFAGSFELEAAEAVCRASLNELQSLTDKSLLRQTDEARFSMLETTREYALRRLEDAGEADELRQRHAEWFFRLVEPDIGDKRSDRIRFWLFGPTQRRWIDRVNAETDNFRAVLAWALENNVQRGLDLAITLGRFWQMRGNLREIALWLDDALALPDAITPESRPWALLCYAFALDLDEESERADEVLTECLRLFQERCDSLGASAALVGLSNVRWAQGDLGQARAFCEEALAIFDRVGERAGMAHSWHSIAEILRDEGQLELATSTFERALAIEGELGDRYGAMGSLHSLGDAELDIRDLRAAAGRYRESLAISYELGDERTQTYCVAGLACVAALQADHRLAGRLWSVVESAEDRLAFRLLSPERQRYEAILRPIEDTSAFRAGASDARTASLQQTVQTLLSEQPGPVWPRVGETSS
jgi:predicted ATPase/class 3 adenylate cyclase